MRNRLTLITIHYPVFAWAQATSGHLSGGSATVSLGAFPSGAANCDISALNISAPNAVGAIRAVQSRDLAGPRNGLIGARLDW